MKEEYARMKPKFVIRDESEAGVAVISEATVAAFNTLEISNHPEIRIRKYAGIGSGGSASGGLLWSVFRRAYAPG